MGIKLLSAPLLHNRGIFQVFSPALDSGKTAFLTIKTARTGKWFVGAAVIARFPIFPALDR